MFGNRSLSLAGRPHGHHLPDLVIGQLLHCTIVRPPFIDHVLNVVRTRSKPQVLRVHAQLHITGVADQEPGRNWSLVDHVRRPMGEVCLSPIFDLTVVPVRLTGVQNAAAIRSH